MVVLQRAGTWFIRKHRIFVYFGLHDVLKKTAKRGNKKNIQSYYSVYCVTS